MSDDAFNPYNHLGGTCRVSEVEWEDIGYGITRGVYHKVLVGCVWKFMETQWRYRLDCALIGQWKTEKTKEMAKKRLFQDFCLKYFKRLPDDSDDGTFNF